MWLNSRIISCSDVGYGVILKVEMQSSHSIKVLEVIFDVVILCSGFEPNTSAFIQREHADDKALYLQHIQNVILTNSSQHTSIRSVYAAGDCAMTI